MVLGQTLGHYRILEKLGAGGMGEVYLAEDTTLKRRVALKVLPAELATSQERLERFQREAETLAALDHPNIVNIYTVEAAGLRAGRLGEEDSGEPIRFLTMQLVEGKRLSELIPKGGMPLERIFDIAIPLADALAAAHEKGVIHRDLKPGNIMVTDEGRVKVLDFGLAKLRPELEAGEATQLPTEPLTDEGKIVGTMPYMSPEQLEGKEIDARSDIFSLGVVLYEMATGERPFKGDSSASLITAIMSHSPREVDSLRAELPHHLSRIVRHCLEKNPESRFQSAKDVRNELQDLQREESLSAAVPVTPEPEPEPAKKRMRWPLVAAAVAGAAIVLIALISLWPNRSQPPTEPPTEALAEPAAAAEAKPPMIVVLPFENLGDPEDEYFADGMTEEITSRLAVVSGLRVISRTSAMRYKEDRPPLKQVGEELGVDYVLEGSVRWARTGDGSRVRITPQLIQVSDDTHLWADTYDRVIDDIFEVQSDIAGEVIHSLGVTLQRDERAALEERPTDSIEGYQAYLRARELQQGGIVVMSESEQQIVEQLTLAVELDPGFAEAWAWLCRHHSFLFYHGVDRTEERASRAKEALEGAERADADSPSTRVARVAFYFSVLQEIEEARRELEVLAKRYPNDPQVLTWLANIFYVQGRVDESKPVAQRITELDPYNPVGWRFLAIYYRAMRRTEEALAIWDRMIELAPALVEGYDGKAAALRILTGDLEAARAVLRQAPGNDSRALTWGWLHQSYWERKWDEVIQLSYAIPSDSPMGIEAAHWRATAMYFRDGAVAARPEIEEALGTIAAALETSPDNSWLHLYSARLHSYLRQDEAALQEAEIALELAAIEGAGTRMLFEEAAANVYANIGREDQALDILERLLESHYRGAITVHELRRLADWDRLHDHPRFQALLEKYGEEAGP